MIAAAEPRRLIGHGEDAPSISGRIRKCTCRLSWRLLGMASTRWISALCAGSSNDTNRKKERMAVRRRLQVLALAPRFVFKIDQECTYERCIQVAQCQIRRGLAEPCCANVNSSRNVSL